MTSPMKRTPLRATVRISLCSSPVSPTARRAALIRLVSVDSKTTRPFQIASEIIPCQHALAVADQIEQEIKHLRLERDQRVRPPQFAALGIEHEILEMDRHAAPRLPLGNQGALSVK